MTVARSRSNSIVADSLGSSPTVASLTLSPDIDLGFNAGGDSETSFPPSTDDSLGPLENFTLSEDFSARRIQASAGPGRGIGFSQEEVADSEGESPVFRLLDSQSQRQEYGEATEAPAPLIGAEILSDISYNSQTQNRFAEPARAQLFWSVTTGMGQDDVMDIRSMDIDNLEADDSSARAARSLAKGNAHLEAHADNQRTRHQSIMSEEDDLCPDDSVSAVALHLSQQNVETQRAGLSPHNKDTCSMPHRRFLVAGDQDGQAPDSDIPVGPSGGDANRQRPEAAADVGGDSGPKEFGREGTARTIPNQRQMDMDDDWITVDTRVSAHSLQSLANRVANKKPMTLHASEHVRSPSTADRATLSRTFGSTTSTGMSSDRAHITSSPSLQNAARRSNIPDGAAHPILAAEAPRVNLDLSLNPQRPEQRGTSTSRTPKKRVHRMIEEETEAEYDLPLPGATSSDERRGRAEMPPEEPDRGSPSMDDQLDTSGGKRVRFHADTRMDRSDMLSVHGDDEPDKVVMACSYKNGKIGAAFYSVRDSKLLLMEDTEENHDFELVKLLIFQVCPSVVVTNGRADETFLQVLTEALPNECTIEIRPSIDFIYTSAKNRLLAIKLTERKQRGFGDDMSVAGTHPHHLRMDMCLYLESIVSMECKEMVTIEEIFVGCAGALLSYISKARLMGEILDAEHEMEIHSVDQFTLKRFMQVNADALCSLQVFVDEAHPNMHNKRGKEGLSLFGILNMTRTPSGKALLKQWFLRPVLDLDTLEQRHRTVGFFLRPDMLYVAEQLGNCLKHVKNIPRILHYMRIKASILDWQALLKFAYYALKMRSAIRDVTDADIHILQRMDQVFDVQVLKDVGSYINNVVDFDQSTNEGRFVVKPQVDEDLDELKRTYHGLDDLLSAVAREVSKIIPQEFARSLNVIYFPQLGYLITIPLKPNMTNEEDFLIDGLYFQFCTANTVYYKSDQMFELDETVGDIHSMIVDREIEIMQRLQETVLEFADSLRQIADVCAEIDCLLSFAEAAKKYNYRKPRMTNENVLHIVKGRHPLQELCVDVFIGNDTKLGCEDEDPRAMLLTGANFSGKSVYLKQVALITYMAHIGSFVPAESALIGLTDKILTRIQTRETVSKLQSAFMIDLHQAAIAMRSSTSRSLVILDEFGKGTATTDGIGLFCAVMEHFVRRGDDCPRLIAATHFHGRVYGLPTTGFQEIKAHGLLGPPSPLLKQFTMEILESQRADGLTFLYRVTPGSAKSSWGIHCAALAGLPANVVERGREVTDRIMKGEAISATPTERDEAKARISKDVSKLFVDFDLQNGDLEELWRALASIEESF
ncbi:MutS protein msh5 [Rhizophlyctis rosea]|nr:MutS protein msh5 [Rhizophlyctis rosea]